MKWPMGDEPRSEPEVLRSPFDENDRAFKLAVKRVVADVLLDIAIEINHTRDPASMLRRTAHRIRNEDAV